MQVLRPATDLAALDALLRPCRLCARRCGVDRPGGERGFCGLGDEAYSYNAFVHWGEEPELVPCFTVFLTGCNLRCPYCSDGEWVDHPQRGHRLEPEAMAARILARPDLRSVEFVGGSADLSLHQVARVARLLPPTLPVVLKSNGWLSAEALELLPAFVDLLLLDLKHVAPDCSAALTGRADYLGPVARALDFGRERLRLGVWLRHLVLPGHRACCTEPALRWLAARAPGARLNVMSQYRPLHQARDDARIGRTLTHAERAELAAWLQEQTLPLELRLDGRPL